MRHSRKSKPFDTILSVRTRLELYVQYGDAALQGQSMTEFIAETHIGPGKRNICPELGRWYRAPNAKTQRCKAPPVTATKAECEALHAAKMVRKGYRRA